MTRYAIIHRTLSNEQIDTINRDGWGSDIGKAYMRSERGDYTEALALGLMKPVAVVEAISLDHAYEMTNSITRYWGENAGILHIAEGGQKSTSMGDVIVDLDTGAVSFVAMFGFEPVTGGFCEAFRKMAATLTVPV